MVSESICHSGTCNIARLAGDSTPTKQTKLRHSEGAKRPKNLLLNIDLDSSHSVMISKTLSNILLRMIGVNIFSLYRRERGEGVFFICLW